MKDKFEWLEKKTPRSIEQLKLWGENPRLNPDEPHSTVADFAEDIIADENDKKHFFDLLRSIAVEYIPADPIVVWKETDNRFYVAEGNRRVLALKLLKDPEKAPKSIRAYVRRISDNRTEKYDKNYISNKAWRGKANKGYKLRSPVKSASLFICASYTKRNSHS